MHSTLPPRTRLCRPFNRLNQAAKLTIMLIHKSHHFLPCTPCNLPATKPVTMSSTMPSTMPNTRPVIIPFTIHRTMLIVMLDTTSNTIIATTPTTSPAAKNATSPATTPAKTPTFTPRRLLPHDQSSPVPCLDSSSKQCCSTHLHQHHQPSWESLTK